MESADRSNNPPRKEVIIIGAGPAGAAAAAWLARAGHAVRVLERSHFPRFSIGESLLPRCMQHLEACGLMEAAAAGGYQRKTGAAFTRRGEHRVIDFRDKFSDGPGTTWQVERADFDQRLIEGARAAGAEVEFGVTVTGFTPARPTQSDTAGHAQAQGPRLTLADGRELQAAFVLDASGYGRVLARLESLERDPRLEPRMALFGHVHDGIADLAPPAEGYRRDTILIASHPVHPDVWYWLIPFANGRASLGVVGPRELIEPAAGDDAQTRLWQWVMEEPRLAELLRDATPANAVQSLGGYSADVSRLHGPGYALLGNAGEFLDPVFSSGVTIALESALRAAPLVARELTATRDEQRPDWAREYELPLRRGIEVFREFVTAWYDSRLTDIIYHPRSPDRIRQMISSVLAGYAWDEANPFVSASRRRLTALATLSAAQATQAETCEPAASALSTAGTRQNDARKGKVSS
ncbi:MULTISPECIES: NAD(P)/FAD-dependent oxidoreductase [Cobetia]|uniref:NAD(P)/FAD-dependent oxidoreductase n=1 Tax=Cobetia TaxID=204286 RepID=UPI0009854DFD|nr:MULTISPECIES: tryptophan 7-halogenase [Cobetia]POR07493.1 FAD-dependent oxidoreductase [Cobetia sp. MM1IDA2H-1]